MPLKHGRAKNLNLGESHHLCKSCWKVLLVGRPLITNSAGLIFLGISVPTNNLLAVKKMCAVITSQ